MLIITIALFAVTIALMPVMAWAQDNNRAWVWYSLSLLWIALGSATMIAFGILMAGQGRDANPLAGTSANVMVGTSHNCLGGTSPLAIGGTSPRSLDNAN